MDKQLEQLLSSQKKDSMPMIRNLLLKEYNQGVDNLLEILLMYSNIKIIHDFFNHANIDSIEVIKSLNKNFDSILSNIYPKKKIKIYLNAMYIIDSLKNVTQLDILKSLLLVLTKSTEDKDVIKKFSTIFIDKRKILNYDYSNLSDMDKQYFEKYFQIVFKKNNLCQHSLSDYANWLEKYGFKKNIIIKEPKKELFQKEESIKQDIDISKNPNYSKGIDNQYKNLDSLISNERENILKLESIIQNLETIHNLSNRLEVVTSERDTLRLELENIQQTSENVQVAISIEKATAEQNMITLKTDIKKSLKQSYNDYMEMKQDESIDKFCLGTIGNIFKVLSRYGINFND